MEDFEILETNKPASQYRSGYADVWSNLILVKSMIVDDYQRAKNFKVYEDDVWLIGYPRSGTTLTKELLWILVNDFDFESAMKADIYSRAVYFEYDFLVFNLKLHERVTCKSLYFLATGIACTNRGNYIDKMSRPRVIKSHNAVQFLPNQIWTVRPRIIHISRDIKDVAVSFYHVRKDIWNDGIGTIEDHFEEILNDKFIWCPYREHLMNYKNLSNYENVCYLTYEQVVMDLKGTIRKLANFLNIKVSDDNVEKLTDHLSFQNMRKNKMVNHQDHIDRWKKDNPHDGENTYIRKGIVGDHKNRMTEATIKRFDEWMAESKHIKSPWDNN